MRATWKRRDEQPERPATRAVRDGLGWVDGRYLPDYVPGLGQVPPTHRLMAVVDELWNESYEAAWPTATYPRGNPLPSGPRLVARHAVAEYVKQWRDEHGPEYAASQGVEREVVLKTFGRPARPGDTDSYPPPDEDHIRAMLADGWLLRYWTQTPDDVS